jgi:hypothetical protein
MPHFGIDMMSLPYILWDFFWMWLYIANGESGYGWSKGVSWIAASCWYTDVLFHVSGEMAPVLMFSHLYGAAIPFIHWYGMSQLKGLWGFIVGFPFIFVIMTAGMLTGDGVRLFFLLCGCIFLHKNCRVSSKVLN